MRSEPVVVALPGTLCSPAVFRPLAHALDGQAVVDPVSWLTQPGPWDIPAVAERVAQHIGGRWDRPVVVCGHSTGGAIALQLAATSPELVLGLVVADTGAHMRGHGDVDAILTRVRNDWGEELRAAVLDRSFLTPLSPEIRAECLQWAAGLNQQAVYDVLASQRDLDLTSSLAQITQPVIVVHGRHDRARPPQNGEELAAALPDAEFRLAESGHTPVYETPALVADAIRDVLRRVNPGMSRASRVSRSRAATHPAPPNRDS
ncbi:MAG: alpha/beta hydrolase [Streptosporangiaceae bacterium]|jgi:pimeloyl-ACP methyl ester carboxylesterase